MLDQKRFDMYAGIERLENGLKVLRKTNEEVKVLKEQLAVKMVDVEAKREATEKLIEEMGVKKREVEEQQAVADAEKNKANAAADEARGIAAEADEELAEAKPKLIAAENAVNCLDKASMTELKGFPKPPPGVDKVTNALLIMMRGETNKKNLTWENAKK